MSPGVLSHHELREAWSLLSNEDRLEGFSLLSHDDAEEVFFTLEVRDQLGLLLALPPNETRLWTRLLAPDDAADVIQEAEEDDRAKLLTLLDEPTRKEVSALLAYAEDEAGGLMNPRYARLRPEASVDEAISYIRRQSPGHIENICDAYVLSTDQKLLGVVSLRELVTAPGAKTVSEIMTTDVVTVDEQTDQEVVSNLFAQHDLVAVPVVDPEGRIKGIVTVDDIVDVVREEATEDMQKIGGTEALEGPYLETRFPEMLRKRVGWLAALLVLGFFAVEAMQRFRTQLESAFVLTLFVPLIIASGGNSGSQAATLVVRAIALGEVRLRDWWRVIRRELAMGLALGGVLGSLAFLMSLVWHTVASRNGDGLGEDYLLIGVTVGVSIVAVALCGTLAGSMLPFALRRLGFDPASASAPLIATVVDVTGLIIYFSVAALLLGDALI